MIKSLNIEAGEKNRDLIESLFFQNQEHLFPGDVNAKCEDGAIKYKTELCLNWVLIFFLFFN